MTPSTTTGFTIADSNYFIGLVAMLTSLRRQGHDFPVVVLDLGLTSPQRQVLERDFGTSCVERSEVVGLHPHLLGPFPRFFEPDGIVVYLDADLIVTRPFDDLISAAAEGMLCAITDDIVLSRSFSEWETTLSLGTPLRNGPYVNLGCLVFSTIHFPDLLGRWWDGCVALADVVHFPTQHNEPFAFGDQDVLNALLLSEVQPERQLILPPHAQPLWPRNLGRTKLIDTHTLACTFDGYPVAFLHPVSKPKPWQPQKRLALYGSGYDRCLRATVEASAQSFRDAETQLPTWLEPGWRGTLQWRKVVLSTWSRTLVRRRLSLLKRRAMGAKWLRKDA